LSHYIEKFGTMRDDLIGRGFDVSTTTLRRWMGDPAMAGFVEKGEARWRQTRPVRSMVSSWENFADVILPAHYARVSETRREIANQRWGITDPTGGTNLRR